MRTDEITRTITTFPGMPGAALKLLALIDDPDVTVQQIEGVLRQDPGLTGNLLQAGQLGLFRIPRQGRLGAPGGGPAGVEARGPDGHRHLHERGHGPYRARLRHARRRALAPLTRRSRSQPRGWCGS